MVWRHGNHPCSNMWQNRGEVEKGVMWCQFLPRPPQIWSCSRFSVSGRCYASGTVLINSFFNLTRTVPTCEHNQGFTFSGQWLSKNYFLLLNFEMYPRGLFPVKRFALFVNIRVKYLWLKTKFPGASAHAWSCVYLYSCMYMCVLLAFCVFLAIWWVAADPRPQEGK